MDGTATAPPPSKVKEDATETKGTVTDGATSANAVTNKIIQSATNANKVTTTVTQSATSANKVTTTVTTDQQQKDATKPLGIVPSVVVVPRGFAGAVGRC